MRHPARGSSLTRRGFALPGARAWDISSLSGYRGSAILRTPHSYLAVLLAILCAHPVHDCETSCFAEFICWAKRSASCRSFCFPFERPSVGAQTFCPSAFLPFPTMHLMVSSADGALPSVDSSPNTISPDLSLGQYSHALKHSVASEKTGQSSIPDPGQHKAMGLFLWE